MVDGVFFKTMRHTMRKILLPLFFAGFLLGYTTNVFSEEQKNSAVTEYSAKNYEYLIDKGCGLKEDLLRMHLKLYQGYVTNANLLRAKLRELDAHNENRTPVYAGLKRLFGWEFDGMILHEYYFENLGARTLLAKEHPLFTKIETDFGSFDAWKADFISTGLMRGIGWVVTYVDPKDGRLVNVWINEHDVGHLAGGSPLLVMDVFEHAYITQFGLDRAQYIDQFWANIDWKTVSDRFQRSKKP
jgi:Fe-Mn family superoxide dismutase